MEMDLFVHFLKNKNMKVLLLFTVTLMIFFLFLIPFICPFGVDTKMSNEAIATSYFFWYTMNFILALVWGNAVYKQGCWFFSK